MQPVKQTASEYLGDCVLVGDIINHTNHISLCGSEKNILEKLHLKNSLFNLCRFNQNAN